MAIQFPQTRTASITFKGGVDSVSPMHSGQDGDCLISQNYEVGLFGGYSRIDGYERFDGRPSPSSATYYNLAYTLSGSVAVGNTINGQTSGATGVILAINVNELIITKLTGNFVAAENLRVSSTVFGVCTKTQQITSALTIEDDDIYFSLAAANYRADIQPVTGSGSILGVWMLNDVVYAVRNNIGGTEANIYKSTASGWSLVSTNYKMAISMFAMAIPDNTAVVGHSSSATTTVLRQVRRTGSYGSTATGIAVTNASVGTFTVGETIRASTGVTATTSVASPCVVGITNHGYTAGTAVMFTGGTLPTGLVAGTTYYVLANSLTASTFQVAATPAGTPINTTGTDTPTHTCYKVYGTAGSVISAITLYPSGKYEIAPYNFAGSINTKRIYGIDGVNSAFEFDGTLYVPISTGMTSDIPSHVVGYKNYLFLSYGASLQFSAIGDPYSWSVVQGAGEIAVGDTITGLVSLSGNSLAIYTKNTTSALTGASSAAWAVQIIAPNTGSIVGSIQQVGMALAMDVRGVSQLNATQAYGDFLFSTISRKVQNIYDNYFSRFSCSSISKSKNQYRIFYNDGYGMYFTFEGEQLTGIMPVTFPDKPYVLYQGTNAGIETSLFGATNGYVYQLDKGTSFDGEAINAYMLMRFNAIGDDRMRKRFRKMVVELVPEKRTVIKMNVDYNFGDSNIAPHRLDTNSLDGGSGYWDISNWSESVWGANIATLSDMSLDGTAQNISLYVFSSSAIEKSHTIDNVTFHYTPRRIQR
jgi:hypothetical protein